MVNIGHQIDPYTLLRKLGSGGFGEVWLAERKSKFVTTKVAVKLPHDDQVDQETIRQEATLWEQASGHPNVLPIIDADEYDGQIVIVSEYAPDGSLELLLKENGKMSVEAAVDTTIQILNGLEFLHSRNIVHRDLKPANILLQGDTPRLADFGISRAMMTTASSQTSNISGTFSYMAPEAFDGKRTVQTDVWSVGVNLFRFLTGAFPFPQRELSMLIAAIVRADAVVIPEGVPVGLRTIISKALSKSPPERYLSAKQMGNDLRRYAFSGSVRTTPAAERVDGESSSTDSAFVEEVETVVRPRKTFRLQNPIGLEGKTSSPTQNLTGNIWKMGIHWGGRQNASHYNYVRSRNIVLGIEKCKYSSGDLVLITDGFKVIAIVWVQDEPKRLKTNPAYSELFEKYGVHREDWVTYANAEWLELQTHQVFQYRSQRGAGAVNLREVKDEAFRLWNSRNG